MQSKCNSAIYSCIYIKKHFVVAFSLRKEAQTKMSNEQKNKHMTLDDRIEIQE